jgi:hypothetical protein
MLADSSVIQVCAPHNGIVTLKPITPIGGYLRAACRPRRHRP